MALDDASRANFGRRLWTPAEFAARREHRAPQGQCNRHAASRSFGTMLLATLTALAAFAAPSPLPPPPSRRCHTRVEHKAMARGTASDAGTSGSATIRSRRFVWSAMFM